MPRLQVWALFTSVASAGAYTLYSLYSPLQSTKREMELFVEAEKSQLARVAQRLFNLQEQINASTRTNAAKIHMYAVLAQLRRDILNLPVRLQTQSEKMSMLEKLDACESTVCTPLAFRMQPLTGSEMLRCFFAYVVFLIQFRIVIPILQQWCGEGGYWGELQMRWMRSRTAKWLLEDVLETSVEMHVHPQLLPSDSPNENVHDQRPRKPFELGGKGRRSSSMATNQDAASHSLIDSRVEDVFMCGPKAHHENNDNPTSLAAEDESMAPAVPLVQLLFTPTCWIEELAFWAAPNNPLLQLEPATRCSEEGSTDSKKSLLKLVYPMKPLIGYSDVNNGRSTRTSDGVLLTESTTAQWDRWAAKSAQQVNETQSKHKFSDLAYSLGYPLAIAEHLTAASGSDGTLVPHVATALCCATGTPRLLYLGASKAGSDAPQRPTAVENVTQLLEHQFNNPSLPPRRSEAELSPEAPPSKKPSSAPPVALDVLPTSTYTVPLFSSVAKWGCYGGSSHGGRKRPTITMAVGAPVSDAADLWNSWMALQQQLNIAENFVHIVENIVV